MTFELEWVKPLHPVGEGDIPHSRLIGHVRILGVDFHVNAEEVIWVNDQQTTIVANEGDTLAPEIWEICDGPGELVTISNRTYLLVIAPFQA